MRIKNITIGYSFPQKLLSSVGVQKLRIYVSGEDLWTITKLSDNLDPEALDGRTYPFQKVYSFGVQITF